MGLWKRKDSLHSWVIVLQIAIGFHYADRKFWKLTRYHISLRRALLIGWLSCQAVIPGPRPISQQWICVTESIMWLSPSLPWLAAGHAYCVCFHSMRPFAHGVSPLAHLSGRSLGHVHSPICKMQNVRDKEGDAVCILMFFGQNALSFGLHSRPIWTHFLFLLKTEFAPLSVINLSVKHSKRPVPI